MNFTTLHFVVESDWLQSLHTFYRTYLNLPLIFQHIIQIFFNNIIVYYLDLVLLYLCYLFRSQLNFQLFKIINGIRLPNPNLIIFPLHFCAFRYQLTA